MSLQATYAAQPATVRGRRTALSYDAKSDRIAYAAGKLVVLRSVADPSQATTYTEHVQPVTSVSFAPSGHYVASGDASGLVRVWSAEFVAKEPVQATSGQINAVAWDFESKRIIAAGQGKQRFGHAFLWDTGNSVGEITGCAAEINAVAIKPSRPLRAVTVGEDTLAFFHGAPFKFAKNA